MVKLYCKESLEILSQMQNKSVDCIITDPPYNFPLETKRAFHIEFVRICKGAIVVFSPPENQWMPTADQYLFWIKPISTKNTSKSYSRFVEMIQVWNGPIWNCDRHWSQYTNVFTDLVDDHEHPYTKPLSMMIRLIRNHTNENNIILDPFMGSGSTGVACINTHREFIGIEHDPDYYKLALQRIEGVK